MRFAFTSQRVRQRIGRALLGVLVVLAVATAADAGGTQRWVVDTVDDFLAGSGDGLAVHPDGRLTPTRPWRAEVVLEEPVVAAGAAAGDGSLIVGTGHPARLYRVAGGAAELLAELEGEQVTALLVEADGAVLVATVAPGVLWRYDDGELDEVGRLGEGGFWDLAVIGGSVVAAAGPPAALFRVTRAGLERWAELPDTHARCLEPMGERLAVGTSGKGLILAVDPGGAVGLLADSPFTEISDLAAAPDGTLWAAALVGEPEPPPAKSAASSSAAGATPTTETGSLDLDLPKVNGTTATSELLRLTPGGALVKVHRFTKQVAATVAWSEEGVLVGTGYEGELWQFVERGGLRLATVDALQVVAIVPAAGRARWLLTQGPAAVMSRAGEVGAVRYRSDLLKLERPASFGRVNVSPARDDVRIRFRSGLSSSPDPTWLPWSEWLPATAERVPLPAATSLQWEVEVGGEGTVPGGDVERVEVAYRELNLAPEVRELKVEEPGAVYLASPPPSGPVIEVDHPDLSGIFSVIGNEAGRPPSSPTQGRKYWRVGFRTVSWKAEDANGDALLFAVAVEDRSGFRLAVRERLDATQLAVDTSALPDGSYRFHVAASDAEVNPGEGLTTTLASEWFEVDNAAPAVSVARQGERWVVSVRDTGSGVARVDWSRDGAGWVAAAADDGLFDSQLETVTMPASAGRHLVVVRAIDRHHNRTTTAVVEEE